MSQLPAQFPVGMVGRVSRSIPALPEEEWKGKAAQTTLSAQESFNILDFFFFSERPIWGGGDVLDRFVSLEKEVSSQRKCVFLFPSPFSFLTCHQNVRKT